MTNRITELLIPSGRSRLEFHIRAGAEPLAVTFRDGYVYLTMVEDLANPIVPMTFVVVVGLADFDIGPIFRSLGGVVANGDWVHIFHEVNA